MKKLILLLSILPLFAFSQSNDTIYPKPNGDQLVISTDALNILYVGIENPISIAIDGVKDKNIVVTTDNGSLEKVSAAHWKAKPNKNGKTKISVFLKKKGKLFPAGAMIFRTFNIPEPISCVAGKSDYSKISKTLILAAPYLFTTFEDFTDGPRFNIISFSCIIGDCNQKEMKNQGANLNDEILDAIKNAKAGDIITFKNIKAMGIDNQIHNIVALHLILQD